MRKRIYLNYKNRFYSPTQGRFISRDPIGYEAGSLGLYEYGGSGSVNVVDPMGLATDDPPWIDSWGPKPPGWGEPDSGAIDPTYPFLDFAFFVGTGKFGVKGCKEIIKKCKLMGKSKKAIKNKIKFNKKQLKNLENELETIKKHMDAAVTKKEKMKWFTKMVDNLDAQQLTKETLEFLKNCK